MSLSLMTPANSRTFLSPCAAMTPALLGLMALKLFVSAAKGISSLQLSRPISRAASTPQDGTSATRAEDLFTKCVSRRARRRRCTYLNSRLSVRLTPESTQNCGCRDVVNFDTTYHVISK